MHVHTEWRTVSWPDVARVCKPVQLGHRKCAMIEGTAAPSAAGAGPCRSLVIQTPWLYLPYAPLHDEKGFASLDFAMWNSDDAFLDRLEELHGTILSKAPDLCKGDHIPPTKPADGFYPRRLKLRGVVWKDVCAFDAMCQPVDPSSVRVEEPLRCLLQLRYVWMNAGMHGIKYQVVQIQTQAPSWKTCLMPPVAQEFAAYDRMKKAGVDVLAIRHKMTMDGLSESAICRWAAATPATAPAPAVAAAAPPPTAHHRPPIALASLLAGKTLLKPPEPVAVATRKRPVGGFEAPSLDDLLKARGSLRKVQR